MGRKRNAAIVGNDLVAQDIANIAGISFEEAKKVLHIVFDTMKAALKRNERIEIRGFGSFNPKIKKPHTHYANLYYKTHIEFPARRAIKFRPGVELMYLINKEG